MLSKLLVMVCLFGAVNSFAQVAPVSPIKTTEKPAEPAIDYKIPGAPMPPLTVARVNDSAKYKDTTVGLPMPSRKESDGLHKTSKPGKKVEQKFLTTEKDLDNGANLFVMMFNPTCSHCQDETDMIEKNISLFNKSKFVFIANPVMARYMPDFIRQMHIHEYDPFLIGVDSSGFLNNVFRFGNLPQINIYDANRKLLKIFNGEAPIDSLRNYIE